MAADVMSHINLALLAANEGIWHWDFESDSIDYTDKVAEFLGYEMGKLPHLYRSGDLVHDEDKEALRKVFSELLHDEAPQAILKHEARMRHSNGTWRWFLIYSTTVRSKDGKVTGLVGSLMDIMKRKQAEEQLLEEKHLMQLLLEKVPLQIYFKDKQSRFTKVSRATMKWLGADSFREVIGQSDEKFFTEKHWKKAMADEKRILKTCEPMENVMEHEIHSDKSETWVISSKYPRPNRKGKIAGTFGVSSDVTELIKTQQQLAQLATELQERNRIYEEELNLAREVQFGLLPKDYPKIIGSKGEYVTFSHRYMPITGLAGDFFDVIEISETSIGLLICDVMGHGLRSALIASMLRGLMERAKTTHAEKPGDFLQALNNGLERLLEHANLTMFATAFYLVIDLEEEKMLYSSAGHPAGIIQRQGKGSLLPFGGRGKGPGLGFFKQVEFPTYEFKLEQGDRVLLFTDGIFEVENDQGQAFLQNRLVKTVSIHAKDHIDELMTDILHDVRSFAKQQKFDDDVCLLGFELCPPD